jgi:glycosyltransferase involved in cell wall biosynthesis
MKILVTSMTDLKASQHNRPHQFVRYLAQKHDVTVLSINDWWKNGQRTSDTYKLGFDDFFDQVDYRYLTHRKISPIAQEVLFHRAGYELLNEGFDVQLNHHSLVTGYELSKSLTTVFDIADDLVAMIKDSPQIPRPLRPYGSALGSFFLQKGITQAQSVTLTCDALKERYRVPDAKSSIIPNGVDLNAFKNHNGKAAISSDGFVVGYVGVLREWVDFEPVFKALRMLDKRIKMLIVGKEGQFRETVDLARTCGVDDRVTFTGQVDYADVPRYIAAMDVCMIPFKSNEISAGAVPLKLFEYMACGKPVISTRLQGVEAVAHDIVQYCSSVEDYAEAITRLYEDETLRKRVGGEGEKLISTNYDWENITKKLEDKLVRAARGETSVKRYQAADAQAISAT